MCILKAISIMTEKHFEQIVVRLWSSRVKFLFI